LFGLKPSFFTDANTFFFVASATFASLLITLDTVFIDTAASFETSLIVTAMLFLIIIALSYYFNDNVCSLTTISMGWCIYVV
jgi:hypothetical protein